MFRRRVKSGKKGKAASESESTKDICNDTAIVQSEDDLSREGRVDEAFTGQETPPSLRNSIEQEVSSSSIYYVEESDDVTYRTPGDDQQQLQFDLDNSLFGQLDPPPTTWRSAKLVEPEPLLLLDIGTEGLELPGDQGLHLGPFSHISSPGMVTII